MLDQDRPGAGRRRRADRVDDHGAPTTGRRSPAPVARRRPAARRRARRQRVARRSGRATRPCAACSATMAVGGDGDDHDHRHRRPGVAGRSDQQRRHGAVARPAADGRLPPVDTDVTRSADVSVVKALTAGGTVAGGPVSWTITVANAGPSTADRRGRHRALPAGRARRRRRPTSAGTCTIDGRHADLRARHGRAPTPGDDHRRRHDRRRLPRHADQLGHGVVVDARSGPGQLQLDGVQHGRRRDRPDDHQVGRPAAGAASARRRRSRSSPATSGRRRRRT